MSCNPETFNVQDVRNVRDSGLNVSPSEAFYQEADSLFRRNSNSRVDTRQKSIDAFEDIRDPFVETLGSNAGGKAEAKTQDDNYADPSMRKDVVKDDVKQLDEKIDPTQKRGDELEEQRREADRKRGDKPSP